MVKQRASRVRLGAIGQRRVRRMPPAPFSSSGPSGQDFFICRGASCRLHQFGRPHRPGSSSLPCAERPRTPWGLMCRKSASVSPGSVDTAFRDAPPRTIRQTPEAPSFCRARPRKLAARAFTSRQGTPHTASQAGAHAASFHAAEAPVGPQAVGMVHLQARPHVGRAHASTHIRQGTTRATDVSETLSLRHPCC